MASFSDSINALGSFNPYRQQLPVQAMREVGQIKQNQYNEGVQKIQSQIDNIAGIDVIKPIHKQYLQSKLNELGNNLRKVAAGDFSNFQLVNSIGGMTNQIIKDPTIQNAVLSTQRVRNQQVNLESAKRNGKSSVQNEAFFNKQLNDWINDKNPNSTYNGEYIEYTDMDKKLREVADKVKEMDNSVDIPYVRDSVGNVIHDAQGNPTIDGAMLSIKTKGKPAEKILANFYDSLNENDKRQLGVDSWYHYKNVTPEGLKIDIVNNYNTKKKLLSDKLINVAIDLKNPNLSSAEKSQLQAQAVDINKSLSTDVLDKELQSQLKQLSNPQGLDDFKYRLYTQKYLSNLARDISYQSYEQAYKENPYFQADMKRKDLQFKYLEENNRNIRFAQEQQLKYLELGLKQSEFDKKYNTSTNPVTSGALTTNEKAPTLLDLQADYDAANNTVKTLGAEYANILFPKEKNPSMTGDDKIRAIGKLVSDYRQNPKMDLTSDQIEYLERYRAMENSLTTYLNLINAAKKKSDEFLQARTNDKLQSVGDLNVGENVYSPTELYNINNKLNSYLSLTPTNKQGRQDKVLWDNKAQQLLNDFQNIEGGKYLPLAQTFIRNNQVNTYLNSKERETINKLKSVDDISKGVEDERQKFESDYIAQHSPKYQVQRAPLDINNDINKKNIESIIATKQAQFDELGALNTDKKAQYDPKEVNNLLYGKNAKSTKILLERKKDGDGQLVLLGGDGDKQIIPMDNRELSQFFPQAAKSSPLSGIVDMIRQSPGNTTNAANIRVDGDNDPSAAVNAYLSGYMLSGLKDSKYAPIVRMDVQGNPHNSGDSQTDKYDVILYVKDPVTNNWKSGVINKGGYTNEGGVISILSNINPQAVEEAIKTYK